MDVAYSATAHVPSEQICEKMIYYTYHSYIIALHYVSVDVSSNFSPAGKIYHNSHQCMVTLQYVCVDVSPHEPSTGKTYHTDHR